MYQNQYTGSFLFLRILTQTATRSSRYSSHYTIAITEPSPLVFSVIAIAIPPFLYQIPVSGYPHFYWIDFLEFARKSNVSMPCLGLSPFLLGITHSSESRIPVCQCPVSGYPHFYNKKKIDAMLLKGVSMPCLGLSPFLPLWLH